MYRFKTARLGFLASGLAVLFALFSAAAIGAPAVQQVSGSFAHKGSVTIGGSGFGTKATAAPLIWDDASGSNIRDKWSGAWPDNNPTYNTMYRAPQRGVPLPHGHITKYIAGAHGQSLGASGGYNVIFFKTITVPSYPYEFYVSWYQTVDPAWSFGGDNNFKTFALSDGSGPYQMPNNWYTQLNTTRFTDAVTTSDLKWTLNDDATPTSNATLVNPDVNGRNWYWGLAVNPIAAGWVKQEMAVRLSSGNDGYIRQWENGVQKVNYQGPTDKYPGYTSPPTTRTIGIGGYARNYNAPTNWRYFADVYLDKTLSRIVLANNATLANATIIETQVPTSWSDGSISATVNLGKFAPGQSAYLFVFNSSGAANAVGYRVTVGGTVVRPNPPESVIIQ